MQYAVNIETMEHTIYAYFPHGNVLNAIFACAQYKSPYISTPVSQLKQVFQNVSKQTDQKSRNTYNLTCLL